MQRINFRKFIIFLAVIILLIFFHFTKVLKPFENGLIMLLNPFNRLVYNLSSRLDWSEVEKKDFNKLSSEKKILEEENSRLVAENVRLKNLEAENEILRKQLKFFSQNKYNYILADIISRRTSANNEDENQGLIINRGQKDGLNIGNILVNEDGIVVGKVTAVEDNIARACLITSANCKLAAAIQNTNRTAGVTEGELGLTIKMNFIPQTENINLGDNIITSGLEKNVPRGLLIGRISKINKESNELWQTATIEPSLLLNNLLFVSVILP